MSLTAEEKKYHEIYEGLQPNTIAAINKAFAAAQKELQKCTMGALANDDRAEALVAAITRYYYDSGRR
jgi:hypothetical protein